MIKHALQKDTVKIGETSIPIMGSYDVVVAGGRRCRMWRQLSLPEREASRR